MAQRRIGKYELGEELGRGAMGIVYKAYDTLLSRDVAVKLMIHTEQSTSESKRRFYREAQSAGSLMHDNIVKIFDLGEEGGAPYIVMEYLPGQDFKELIRGGKLTSYREILKIWLQICNGLHHAHKRGLIHRDIKPGNIRIIPGGRVKIMDFGIAKKHSSDLTQSGVVMGTVDYMAPEQVKGAGADARSDLFSMGVMCYETLTGHKPFEGDSVTAVIYKIVYEAPPPMKMTLEAPADMPDVIAKLLHKDAAQRYPSALDLAKALKASYVEWKASKGQTMGHDILPTSELPMTGVLPQLNEVERTVFTPRNPPSGPHATLAIAPPTPAPPSPAPASAPPAPTPAPPAVAPPAAPVSGAHASSRPVVVVAPPTAPAPAPQPPPPRPVEAPAPPRFATGADPRAHDPRGPGETTVQGNRAAPDHAASTVGAGLDHASLAPRIAAAMTVDDLPMRPHAPGPASAGASPLGHRDAMTMRAPQALGNATLVDVEEPAHPRATPGARRISPYWIGMVLLFLVVVAGAGFALKVYRPADPTPTTPPTLPVAATPTPAPVTPTPLTPAPPPTQSSISITTNLPCEVLVDGQAVGRLPSSTPLVVPPGKHRITLKETKFGVTQDGEYEVDPGRATTIDLPFTGNGTLQIRVKPWANVTIDGDAARALEIQAASQPLSLPAGEHRIEFEQLGKRVTKSVFIVPRQSADLDVDMTGAP